MHPGAIHYNACDPTALMLLQINARQLDQQTRSRRFKCISENKDKFFGTWDPQYFWQNEAYHELNKSEEIKNDSYKLCYLSKEIDNRTLNMYTRN